MAAQFVRRSLRCLCIATALPLNPAILPEGRVKPVIAMIADAARYLGRAEHFVIVRSKPENIIVTSDARRATLLELGVLRAFSSNDLRSGPLPGLEPTTLSSREGTPRRNCSVAS